MVVRLVVFLHLMLASQALLSCLATHARALHISAIKFFLSSGSPVKTLRSFNFATGLPTIQISAVICDIFTSRAVFRTHVLVPDLPLDLIRTVLELYHAPN